MATVTGDWPLEHHEIATSRLRLHVVQSGPMDGPLVILLHGFPEFWYGWRRQIGFLAEQGYRVWAPDQRGYNTSDKPPRVRDYSLEETSRDVLDLIAASGRGEVRLVGHDWGGVVVWNIATLHPTAARQYVVINVPHPAVMLRHLGTNPRQMLRSWYVLAFQMPWLPEALIARRNWQPMVQGLIDTSLPGTFTEEDFEHYRQAWSQPRAMECMINWYRAALRHRPRWTENALIAAPTLLLWGAHDRFAGRELARPSIERCRQGELILIEEATHWVQHERAAEVNAHLARFFAER
jgi:pimeloyl-ACP methyl ester carboxylesterase